MKKIAVLPLILFLLNSFFLLPDDPDAQQIIRNVQKKVDKYALIVAKFEQTFVWSMADEQQTFQGELYIGKNDQFRIRTPEQLIVSDGKSVWTVDQLNNQVVIDYLDNSEDSFLPRQLFVRFHKDYKAVLAGKETVNGKECFHLILTPKNQDVYIRKLEVWIDGADWLTQKVSYLDVNDNTTSYLIRNIELLNRTDLKLFSYSPEEGLEVIDMRK